MGGCGGRACRLPVPASLQHTAAGGGSNTFGVESAVVRPISGGSDNTGSYTIGTPSSPSPCSSSTGMGGRGRGHDAATVFRQGAEAYHMPPLQLVPPGTTFDPNAPPEVQVQSMAVRMS